MTKLPSYKTIAGDVNAQGSYLLQRCQEAEGKEPDDTEAMMALLADTEGVSQL